MGIHWLQGNVADLDVKQQTLRLGEEILAYDYLVVATGADLNLEAVPGLGPEQGYTQSVCNPHHAEIARDAWRQFLENPGPLVVGAVPGASCFGPAYEFALLADHVLRRKGLRQQVPITLVTPEPYAGHLGIGGMANSAELVLKLLAKREVSILDNTVIEAIGPDSIQIGNGRRLPFAYTMLLPPFQGADFLRAVPGLTDAKGFLPVLPTYEHPDFPSIYSVGVITQLSPPEHTPIPIGVPKTGQMTESMGMAVAHNIARQLGVLQGSLMTPTLEAVCFADFGKTGILFLADPVLPVADLGRRRAIALQGPWVSWAKKAFEQYFLAKVRWGAAVPWFERLGLRSIGLQLIKPLSTAPGAEHQEVS